MYKNKKKQLTEIIINQLPDNSLYKTIPIDKTIARWWMTGWHTDNLRLTIDGKFAFDEAKIEFFDFALFTEEEFKSRKNSKKFYNDHKFLTKLKNIDCPFYIGQKTQQYISSYIRVYDSKIAVMIGLYGNIENYLESFR